MHLRMLAVCVTALVGGVVGAAVNSSTVTSPNGQSSAAPASSSSAAPAGPSQAKSSSAAAPSTLKPASSAASLPPGSNASVASSSGPPASNGSNEAAGSTEAAPVTASHGLLQNNDPITTPENGTNGDRRLGGHFHKRRNLTAESLHVPHLGCGVCNYSGLWLDIMLVLDSSTSMTKNGLHELVSYIAPSVVQMSISQLPGQYSRIGVITYSDVATLRNPLTEFDDNTDFENVMFNIPYEGGKGSNIEHGIRLALEEFEANGQGQFANRKKVIVLASSHYEPGASTDPKQAASIFRGNGGHIITIEYVQNHGAPVPVLDELATNCSQLSNRLDDLQNDDLLDAFCNANCFCAANWDPFPDDTQCPTADYGCFYPVLIPTTWRFAQQNCADKNNGTLPTVCDKGTANFLNNLMRGKAQQQWIGLSVDAQTNAYQWADNTPFDQTCQPSNDPNLGPVWKDTNGATAVQGNAISLEQANEVNQFAALEANRKGYLYTCQNVACSSNRYCELVS